MKINFKQATIIPVGVSVVLTPEQYDARQNALTPVVSKKKGVYQVEKPVQFKAGETVEIYGDIPKGLLPVELAHKAPENDSTSDPVE